MTSRPLSPSQLLQQLRLGGAFALLGEEVTASLPSPRHDLVAHLQAIIDGLCGLSSRDPLTGIANRRHFDYILDRELDRVTRSGDSALLLMVDIDHFKWVNDQYGHNVGDLVLQQVAAVLAQCVRPMDTLARYGGEEFAIVVPACQPAYGCSVAERIRHVVENLSIRIASECDIRVTVSVGGAYALQWIRSTRELWIKRADQQLYLAKDNGRNRIEIEQQPDSTVTAEEKIMLFTPELRTVPQDHDANETLGTPIDQIDGVY